MAAAALIVVISANLQEKKVNMGQTHLMSTTLHGGIHFAQTADWVGLVRGAKRTTDSRVELKSICSAVNFLLAEWQSVIRAKVYMLDQDYDGVQAGNVH